MSKGKTKYIKKIKDELILQLDFAGFLIASYRTLKEASASIGTSRGGINRSILEKDYQCAGYFWKRIKKSEFKITDYKTR